MFRPLFLSLICFAYSFGLQSQNIVKVASSPRIQKVFFGEAAEYKITITASENFKQQLIIGVSCATLNSEDVEYSIEQPIVTYPYSNNSVITITLHGSASIGTHYVIFKASNGPIVAFDTVSLVVEEEKCKWIILNDRRDSLTNSLKDFTIYKYDRSGALWGKNSTQLVKVEKNKITKYDIPLPTYENILNFDYNNNIWIINNEELLSFDGTYWSIYNKSTSNIPSNHISSIDFGKDSKTWVSTDKGFASYDGSTWKVYDSLNTKLPFNFCRRLKVDNIGNIWIVNKNQNYHDNENATLTMFDGQNIINYSVDNSCLPAAYGFLINFDISNNLYLQVITTEDPNALPNDYSYTENDGFVKFDGKTWERWFLYSKRPYNHTIQDIKCNMLLNDTMSASRNVYGNFTVDNEGDLWIMAEDHYTNKLGIQSFDGNAWQFYNYINTVLPNQPYSRFYSIQLYKDSIYAFFENHRYQYNCADNLNSFIKVKVHQGNGYMNTGYVVLRRVSDSKSYLQQIDSSGDFNFNNIPTGKYLVEAFPSESGFYPTFYPGTTNEGNAAAISINNDTTSIEIFLNIITATESGSKDNLYLFSNVFSNEFQVDLKKDFKIFDLTGKIVFDGHPNTGTINTSNWPEGCYFVRIEGNANFKIIKINHTD